jgi:TPR repeat protein
MINRTNLDSLPDDLKYMLGLILPGRDLLSLGRTNQQLRMFYNDDYFWIQKYKNDFGPLPFPHDVTDIKAQYLAAEMHHQGKYCLRPDIMQIIYRQLLEFLQHHQHRPWRYYYIGMMNCYGAGIPLNLNKGIHFLLESLYAGDQRSALLLADVVLCEPKKTGLIKSHEEKLLQSLFDICEHHGTAAHKGFAALLLADFFNKGRLIEQDSSAAERWYLHAFDHGQEEAVHALVHLEKEEQSVILYLDQLINRIRASKSEHTGKMLAAIHYQAGLHYEVLNCEELAEERFALASTGGHGAAQYSYAVYLQKKAVRQNDPAKQAACAALYYHYIKQSAGSGYDKAVFERYAKRKEFAETLTDHEGFFLAGSAQAHILAERIGVEYCYARKQNAPDPVVVWWMQLCIQCNGNNTLPVRIKNEIMIPKVTDRYPENGHVVYCLCARGIIYLFGIKGSSFVPDHAQAKKYFDYALGADAGALDKYLAAGRKSNIISAGMEKVIRTEINKALQHGDPTLKVQPRRL